MIHVGCGGKVKTQWCSTDRGNKYEGEECQKCGEQVGEDEMVEEESDDE